MIGTRIVGPNLLFCSLFPVLPYDAAADRRLLVSSIRPPTHAALTGEQAEHLARVLRASPANSSTL